jgi:hypothetical protein
MTQQERKKRSDPRRTAPRRAFVRHDHPGVIQQADAAPDSHPEPGSIQEVIGNAVNLGYGVVDEYLQHGRQAARRIRAGSYSSADIEDDLSTLVPQVVRMIQDAAVAWMDILSATTRAVAPQASGATASVPISIEVRSVRPAQVILDLHPALSRFVPIVPALYPQSPGKRPLTDVKFGLSPDRAHATLTITVPDDLPPGTYTGVITDSATHEPGGTLCVHLDPKN